MKFTLTLISVALVAMLATGCATNRQTGMLIGAVVGTAVGGPIGGTTAAHIVGGVVGAVIGTAVGGTIGAAMDRRDHQLAKMAVQANTPSTWVNKESNTIYTVTPKDNGDNTSTVKSEMTRGGQTTVETSTVKRIKE